MRSRLKIRGLAGPAFAILAGLSLAPATAQCGPRRTNPCAPQAANPCAGKNPCGVNNPCSPAANPCNPCGANPCNPCGAAPAASLTDEQAAALYKKLASKLKSGYAKSGSGTAAAYQGWKKYNTVPYQSATHGGRYVNNYADATASDYGKFDAELVLPVGSVLAKDSIVALPDGDAEPGPLFLMEKMASGFNSASADWKYTLIMPDGTVVGVTNGPGSESVAFCHQCHQAAGASQLFFLPEAYRAK
jgi:hypothetical protein